jgi:hypothetical protein
VIKALADDRLEADAARQARWDADNKKAAEGAFNEMTGQTDAARRQREQASRLARWLDGQRQSA